MWVESRQRAKVTQIKYSIIGFQEHLKFALFVFLVCIYISIKKKCAASCYIVGVQRYGSHTEAKARQDTDCLTGMNYSMIGFFIADSLKMQQSHSVDLKCW